MKKTYNKFHESLNINYSLRLATVDEILNLRHRILRKGFPIEEVMFEEDKLISTKNYAIFDEKDNVIACLTLMKAEWKNGLIWRLRAMAVDEEFQGNGLGSELLEFALEDLEKSNNMDSIWLHARTTSQNFYKKFDFEVASEVFNFGNAGPSVKMLKKSNKKNFTIETPQKDNLVKCYELEKHYSINNNTDESKGFFLPGTTLETYESLFKSGYIKVLKKDEILIAFVIVVPPGHTIVNSLLTSDSMLLFDNGKIDIDKCYWIAKVAVHPEYTKLGYAIKLYEQLEYDFKDFTGFTATAVSPLRNYPSEKLHEDFKMKKCGIYITKKDEKSFTSIVWKK